MNHPMEVDQYPEIEDEPGFAWMGNPSPPPPEQFRNRPPPIYEGFVPQHYPENSYNAFGDGVAVVIPKGTFYGGPSQNILYEYPSPMEEDNEEGDDEEDDEHSADFAEENRRDSTGEDEDFVSDDHSIDEEHPVETVRGRGRPRGSGRGRGSGTSQSRGNGRGRGRGRGRGQGRGRGRGRGQGGTRGRGKGDRPSGVVSKGTKRGVRAALEPSHEFKVLQAQAFSAFIDEQDNEKALDLVKQAITLNPEVYAAHQLLSEIFEAQGQKDKAYIALFSAAHTNPREPNVWRKVASASLERMEQEPTRAMNAAVYCYSRLMEINQKDYHTYFERAVLNKRLGHKKKALKECEWLLKHLPHDTGILRQIAEVCLDLNQCDTAKGHYDESIKYYQSLDLEAALNFTWVDVYIYVDLLSSSNHYEQAISALKSLSRWLSGRKDDIIWDEIEDDDREWDAEDEPRRITTPTFTPGEYPPDSYGENLPLELRIKLGIYRLKLGGPSREEAFRHFEWLDPDSRADDAKVLEVPEMVREVADGLTAAKEDKEAFRYYLPLLEAEIIKDADFFLKAGACAEKCDDIGQAEYCYTEAISKDPKLADAHIKLSGVLDLLGDADAALEHVTEAIRLGREVEGGRQKRKYRKRAPRGGLGQNMPTESEVKVSDLPKLLPKPVPGVTEDGPQTTPLRYPLNPDGTPMETSDLGATYRSEDVVKNQISNKTPGRSLFLTPKKARWGTKNRILRSLARSRTQDKWKPLTKADKDAAEERDRNRTQHIQQLWTTLQQLQKPMRDGSEEAREDWLDTADEMLRDFRSNRVFYPWERHQKFEGYDKDARQAQFRKKKVKISDSLSKLSNQDASRTGLEDMAMRLQAKIDGTPESFSEPLLTDPPTSRSTKEIPADYRGIAFGDWLDIFLECALLLAGTGDKSDCYETLVAATDCVVFYHDQTALLHIHVCYFTCALRLADDDTMCDVARYFMREYQFVSSSYRLFAALNRLYRPKTVVEGPKRATAQATWYRDPPEMKYLLRQVKAMDFSLPRPPNNGPDSDGEVPPPRLTATGSGNIYSHRASLSTRDEHGKPIPATRMDINLLVLYAHILYSGGTFGGALNYLFRAYALDPTDPLVLLSIALSYAHQALKRQAENRHFLIVQGLAFMGEYEKAKLANGTGLLAERQEVEFNKGRVWGMLSINHLAVECYTRVLDMAKEDEEEVQGNLRTDSMAMDGVEGVAVQETGNGEEDDDDDFHEDFTMEAAVALQEIYGLSGEVEMARRITEKWLVF